MMWTPGKGLNTQTKFYEFNQNNAGGKFVTNDKLAKNLIIEARSANEANLIAEELGVDFRDYCECCGDRWRKADENNGFILPFSAPYIGTITTLKQYCNVSFLDDFRVFFADGSVEYYE